MNKFLLFSILLLVGCQEQTTKQQEKQVENSSVQVPSSVYANSRWKCPYCGMELDVFDTIISKRNVCKRNLLEVLLTKMTLKMHTKKAMRRALKRETKMVMIKDIMRLPTTSGKNIISNS